MKKIAGLLMAGALLVPAPADAGASCGGYSPIVPNCTANGVLTDFTPTLVIDVGALYTGYVVVNIATGTGTYRAECHYLVGSLEGCNETYNGFLLPGQNYVMRGDTGLALLGPDLRGLAVGRWEIRVEQN